MKITSSTAVTTATPGPVSRLPPAVVRGVDPVKVVPDDIEHKKHNHSPAAELTTLPYSTTVFPNKIIGK